MKNLAHASMLESIRDHVDEIGSIMREHGVDPSDYDIDDLDVGRMPKGDVTTIGRLVSALNDVVA